MNIPADKITIKDKEGNVVMVMNEEAYTLSVGYQIELVASMKD